MIGRLLRHAWSWSPLVTAPLLALTLAWGYGTWRTWRDIAVEYETDPVPYGLIEIGRDRAGTLLRGLGVRSSGRRDEPAPAASTAVSTAGAPPAGVPVLELQVAADDLAALHADLPHSGFEYVPGVLVADERRHPVEVRFRGDFMQHWGHPKKSWRVRTRRDDLHDGMRTFNVIAPKYPEQLNNLLSYRLAARLGLVTPRCDLVELHLCGRSRGLHLRVEQPGEAMLWRHGLLPSDHYVGELIARDAYAGIRNSVFEHPGLWKKADADPERSDDDITPLREFLARVMAPYDESAAIALLDWLDVDAWGRFFAFVALAQTWHFDDVHNWRLVFDARRRRILPVVWDPIGWSPGMRPAAPDSPVQLDVVADRLHYKLQMLGPVLAARRRALAEFAARGLDPFLAEVDAEVARALPVLDRDPLLRPARLGGVADEVAALRDTVARCLREVCAAHLQRRAVRWRPTAGGGLLLELRDRAGIDALALRSPAIGRLAALPRVTVTRALASGAVVADVTGACARTGDELRLGLQLVAEHRTQLRPATGYVLKNPRRVPVPTSYEIEIEGLTIDEATVVRVEQDGSGHPAEPAADIVARPSFELFAAPVPHGAPITWSGTVDVDGVMRIDADLVLAPGTTVRLRAGSGLLCTGRLLAVGEAAAPIRFEGLDAAPWGAVVLLRHGASGSRLAHCRFTGGSSLRHAGGQWPGMLVVAGAEDVRLERCVLHGGAGDLLHASYAELALVAVTLEAAGDDCLHADHCAVQCEGLRCAKAGDDAVFVEGSQLLAERLDVMDAADEALSIGADSAAWVQDTLIAGCPTAVLARDGADVVVVHAEVRDAKRLVSAAARQWRHRRGGTVTWWLSRVSGRSEVDEASVVRVIESDVAGAPEPATGPPETSELPAMPTGLVALEARWRGVRDRAQRTTRGALHRNEPRESPR